MSALTLLRELVDGVKALHQFITESRNEAWFQSWQQAMVQVRNAKTSEDRQNAAGAIQDALSKL